MNDLYPGRTTFFVILAAIIIVNIVVVMVGIPILPIILGIVFVGWIIWGFITLATKEQRDG